MTLNRILCRPDINIILGATNALTCGPRDFDSDNYPQYCPDNNIDEPNLFYFTPHFMKVIGLLIIILYLIDYYTTPVIRRTKSSFYDILSFYCIVLLTRTGFTTSVALVLRVTDEFTTTKLVESGPQYVLVQVCMYLDWIGDDFSMVMIFLMALNRCLHFAAKDVSQRIFKK
ncbi:hypothetical protein CRE_04359 [Caenorhabditis remanei]|uniref:Uncharacterized protein n=1 Tax=Caenorhabditis remanei TaxID=31234 RepID=E3NIB2_CAERE|nr:hypothetical protein CRE_04359 [Caenorhabditis remanei]